MPSKIDRYLEQLNPDQNTRLDAFFEQYCQKDEAYLLFAAHAAFPVVLTVDLLYKLWTNFRQDERGQTMQLPQAVVSDLLLSPLCQTISRHVYEIPQGIRTELQRYLAEHSQFGTKRLDRLAHFLKHYLQENPQKIPSPAFYQAQEFAYLTRLEPQKAAERLAKAWNEAKHISELQHLMDQAEMLDTVEVNQEPVKKGRNQPRVVVNLLKGLKEYRYKEPEKLLEWFKELQGQIREDGSQGGIKVNVDQGLLEALSEEVVVRDDRPVFLGVFNTIYEENTLSGVAKEKQLIEAKFRDIPQIKLVFLDNPTKEDLIQTFLEFRNNILIFHYAGTSDANQLIINDKEGFSPKELRRYINTFSSLKLAFFNGPYTIEFVKGFEELDVPIIATPNDLSDRGAMQFAVHFYDFITKNNHIYDSFNYAIERSNNNLNEG